MSENQSTARAYYQPSSERLAFLLEQLSELDPDGDKRAKFEPLPEKKPERRLGFEAVQPPRPKLEPMLIRKAEPVAVSASIEVEAPEPASSKKPAAKSVARSVATPPKKAQPQKAVARKAAPKVKAKLQPASKAPAKTKSRTNSKTKAESKSFHAVLRNYAKDQVRLSPEAQARFLHPPSTLTPWAALTQRGVLGALVRGWSWLNSKYKTSAAKRLRLSEVVSLGDKRFVALIKVEDREFLIGGAASGLSLLSPLEAPAGTVEVRKRGIGSGGKSR